MAALRFDGVLFSRPDLLYHSPMPSWACKLRQELEGEPVVMTRLPDWAYLMARSQMETVLVEPDRDYWECRADFPPSMSLEQYWSARFNARGVHEKFQMSRSALPCFLTRLTKEEAHLPGNNCLVADCAPTDATGRIVAAQANLSALCAIGKRSPGQACAFAKESCALSRIDHSHGMKEVTGSEITRLK